MDQAYENRKYSRHTANASLVYWINLSPVHCYGKKIDHSDTGIAFNSNFELKPGTVVYIRRKGCPPNCPAGPLCRNCREAALATVKWCRRNESHGIESYTVGAEYLHSYGWQELQDASLPIASGYRISGWRNCS